MTIDRRGFLGRLLGGLAVAALAPAVDLFGTSLDALTAPAPTYEDIFHRLMMESLRRFERRLSGNYQLVTGGRLEETGLINQFGVDFMPGQSLNEDTFDAFMDRQVDPALVQLATRVEHATKFGLLPLPTAAMRAFRVDNERRGISMRGITDYVMETNGFMLRLDVVTD